ncbi:28552_t:CDS:2, partial [Gigaspora margarita]
SVKELKALLSGGNQYLDISPDGDVVIEFELLKNESKYIFRLYNVEKPDKNLKNSDNLSYSKLTIIHTSKAFEFTNKQLELIKNKLSWSVAVSDKSSTEPKFRLLAISCISHDDMTLRIEDPSKKISGFTIVFTIRDNSNDTIRDNSIDTIRIEKISQFNQDSGNVYGGIIKLFFKHEDIQNADRCLLIILNISGIYKFHFRQLNHKPTFRIRKLRYPRRTTVVMEYYNDYHYKIYKNSSEHKKIIDLNMEYIKACLNKHYFLADTMLEGSQYMDLYDLKTTQLINTFQRRNISGSGLTYRPGFFEISKNNKLLAYKFKSAKKIKLYSVECGLQLASIIIDETDQISCDYYFLHFFSDDERLLLYRITTNEWSIWDIFGSIQESIKLENQSKFEFNLQEVEYVYTEKLKKSNSFIVTMKNNKPVIYDDLISDNYLESLKSWKRKVNKSDLKSLSLEEIFVKKSQDKHEYFIWEFNKTSELKECYHVIEPWLGRIGRDTGPQYSVYLDEKKEILLLIGNCTIQIWRDHFENRTLEFISVCCDEIDEIEVKKIEYGIRKFKLSIQHKDSNSEIKMGDDDNDVIKAAKEACYALTYLNKWSQIPNYGNAVSITKINEIVKQTRNIIVRFIQLYPVVWRLLDFRFNLMSTLIKANEHTLVKHILFDEKKEVTSVDDSENHILKTLEYIVSEMKVKKPSSDLDDLDTKDPVFLGFLLEYYSNKATKEIGWMITVYKSFAQILFYKSCFCQKKLDISSFEFLEIPPSMENSLKVFIPVTQLIPQNSVLETKILSQYIIPNILMVPLIDFTTTKINKKSSLDVKNENKFTNFLKLIFYPGKYVQQEDYYSPFLKLVEKIESNDPFYYNPSMEATMNVMCQSSNTYELTDENGVVYNMTEEEPEDSFSNIFNAIIAAYNWDSISLDTWHFWSLIIIGVIGNIAFVIILQNMIVSFMSAAFEDADENGKRAVLNFQKGLISYYAFLEDSIFITGRSEFDSKLKNKLRMRYICFYNEESITKKWVEKSEEWKSTPIYENAEGQAKTESEVVIDNENFKFIWTSGNQMEKQ